MWGADILVAIIESVFILRIISHISTIREIAWIVLVRLLAGFLGQRFYFYRHGSFPGS